MTLLAFPVQDRPGGTVHVFRHADGGFEIGHESSSGGSWGSFSGPYQLAEAAIAAAYALARETYGGCEILICEAALSEVQVGAGLQNQPYQLGDF